MHTFTAIPNNGWEVKAGMNIDGDGSPRCYGPNNSGLDYNSNGGPASDPYGYELNPHTGHPYVQGVDAPAFSEATKGFYVSSTSYQRRQYASNDPQRYLNSETELFVVVPGAFRKHVPGIVLGCKVEIEFKGRTVVGVVGDIGPDFGEASIAVAKAFGLPGSPRNGGTSETVIYRIYPGVSVEGYELQPV